MTTIDAKYTMLFCDVEKYFENKGEPLFDFEYTIDPSVTKSQIENTFSRHYHFEEIGQETPEMFKYYLQTQWLETLGEYNKIFKMYNKDYDATHNDVVDIAESETSQGTNEKTGTNNGSTTTDTTTSDTPQSILDDLKDYATEKVKNSNKTDITNTENAKDNRQITRTHTETNNRGKTEFENMEFFRKNIVDVVDEFVASFSNLFMRIF